jgi:hypothetical protein
MKKNFLLVLALLGLSIQLSHAQSDSYGTWTSIGIEKKIHKWNFGAETELRTINYLGRINRGSISLSADYSILKHLKIGIGYQLMNNWDEKYWNYQIRNRFNVSGTGKLKWDKFSFSLREKLQVTFKDESNRIKSNGTIDTYKINPEWVWRNRMQISYNIPHCRLTPAFSVESFYQLNNPDGNAFDNLRYILSLDYKINKRNSVSIYGLINSRLNSDNISGKYILGTSYVFSF